MTGAELLDRLVRIVSHDIFWGLLALGIGLVFVRYLASVVERSFAASAHPHWALVANKVVSYAGTLAVVLVAAQTAGINITAVIATAGVAGVAIGFAAQTSLSNLIAGIFLLVDRPFQVGDSIELEGKLGVVHEITLLSTFIRTFDNLVVRWPNEVVLKATITNYTRNPVRRLDLPIVVSRTADVEQTRALLREALRGLELVLIDPAAEVHAKGFLDTGLELEARVWIRQSDVLDARNQSLAAMQRTLLEAGIAYGASRVALLEERG